MNRTWKLYGWNILIPLAVGGLSGLLTRDGVRYFNTAAVQPPLSPPEWVFPVVWGLLYLLMGVSTARVRLVPPSQAGTTGLNLYALQLTVNFFWSLIFFNIRAYGFAAVWLALLMVLVLGMILAFRKADRAAAWLQVPYLLWLGFALYLNLGVWRLNPKI